ncbi:hypothetical protein HHI36_005765, partial [Cryptolaemus montrouzieri]
RVKESQDTELVNRYNEYSKQIKSDVKMRKQEYYRNEITQNMNNPKEMRKTVNEFSGRGNEGSRNGIESIVMHGREITDEREIASQFNEFFTGVWRKLAQKIKQPLRVHDQQSERSMKSFVLKPTTPREVMKIIKGLKTKNYARH